MIVLSTFWWVSSASDRGQAILDNYGKHPSNKEDAARYHAAMKLLTGHWNDDQKAVMLKYINHATKDLEPLIWQSFDKDNAVDIFYNIGTADISDIRAVYAVPFAKSHVMDGWTAEQKALVWQKNLALGFVRYDLSPDQQSFLIDYAQALPAIFAADKETARQMVGKWDAEAATKFPRTIGRGLFTTIGKDGCRPDGFVASIKGYFEGLCVCNKDTYNWSCTDSCQDAKCTTDPGDCGPFYLWDCTAMCTLQDQ